ncbi:MAG: MATE family efflux transporter [Myxococcota bacterium]
MTQPPEDDSPELASSLLDLRDKPPAPLAPSPQALGVWELAWPTIAAAMLQTLVRWADIKMVGALGREAVAAVAAGGQVYWFLQSTVMAVTIGLVAIMARAIGARDTRGADAVLRQGILLGTLFGAVTMAAMPWASSMISMYGVEESVVAYGGDYVFWLLAGNIPFTLTFVFGAALRAAGDARSPLAVGAVANALNVALNWLLIGGHLGFPRLGVSGAAIASSASMVFQVVVFWALWRSRRLVLRPELRDFRPDLALWRRILRIGYPATLEGALWNLGLLGFMRLMSDYGTAEFAAYNIGAQILAISFLPGNGFATAASTLVGQHLGDRRPDRAARSGWRSLAGSIVSMSALGALTIGLARPIARFFISDAQVVDLTVDFIWILGAVQPLMAVEFTLGGALRGAGDTRFPLVVVFVGLFLCRLLPASLAALWLHTPIQVVWSALVLDYAVKAILLIWRFRRGRWRSLRV